MNQKELEQENARLRSTVEQMQRKKEREKKVEKLFYSYSMDVTLTAGATASDSIAIEADSDFVLVKTTMFSTDNAGASQQYNDRIIPLVTMQLTDTGSGRNLFDAEQALPNLFGTGEIPFIWPVAQTIRANSVLRGNFTSLEAANTRRIFLSFVGFKLYKYG